MVVTEGDVSAGDQHFRGGADSNHDKVKDMTTEVVAGVGWRNRPLEVRRPRNLEVKVLDSCGC